MIVKEIHEKITADKSISEETRPMDQKMSWVSGEAYTVCWVQCWSGSSSSSSSPSCWPTSSGEDLGEEVVNCVCYFHTESKSAEVINFCQLFFSFLSLLIIYGKNPKKPFQIQILLLKTFPMIPNMIYLENIHQILLILIF